MVERRRWEDLETECLINVFARVDTKRLATSVQFVCKSWYKTALIPQCWLNFVFTARIFSVDFVRAAVDRSKKAAISVIFTCGFDADIIVQSLLCIAQGCPLLKVLRLPSFANDNLINGLIPNWKNLECIEIRELYSYMGTLRSISLHCKNFTQLFMTMVKMCDEEALMICQLTPRVKVLRLYCCKITRLGIEMIVKSLKELEYFYVSLCDGDDEIDGDEIRKLAPRINYFKFSRYIRNGRLYRQPDEGNDSEDDEDYYSKVHMDNDHADYEDYGHEVYVPTPPVYNPSAPQYRL